MRNLIILLLLLGSTSLKGQDALRTSFGVNQIKTTDFSDFHISDWDTYGLGSLEGRMAVNLEDMDPKGMVYSLFIGPSWNLKWGLDIEADINVGLGNFNFNFVSLSGLFGINWKVVNGANFNLGISPKVGYQLINFKMGTIEPLSGYSFVHLPEGSIYEGDTLSMKVNSAVFKIALNPEFVLTEKLNLRTTIGYQLNLAQKPKITVTHQGGSNLNIPFSSNAIIKPINGSSEPAGISPQIFTTGTTIEIGLVFKIETSGN